MAMLAALAAGGVHTAGAQERSTPAPGSTATPITLHYNARIPFEYLEGGEVKALLAQTDLPARDFAFVTYPGTPQGELRYIMCSQQVPPAVMDRLNATITFKDR